MGSQQHECLYLIIPCVPKSNQNPQLTVSIIFHGTRGLQPFEVRSPFTATKLVCPLLRLFSGDAIQFFAVERFMKSTLVRKLFRFPATLVPVDGLNTFGGSCGFCCSGSPDGGSCPASSSLSSELSLLLLLSLLSLSSRIDVCCFKRRARSFLCCACIY